MSSNQRRTFFILIIIGLIYFLAFIPPNLTGARDANMLSVFEADEFAQYPNVIRMLTLGETPYQSLRRSLRTGANFKYCHTCYIARPPDQADWKMSYS